MRDFVVIPILAIRQLHYRAIQPLTCAVVKLNCLYSFVMERVSHSSSKAYPKTLRYAALMVMGLNVDDAIDQLDLHPKKEAQELKETIVEAVDLAIHHHGFEYRWFLDQ